MKEPIPEPSAGDQVLHIAGVITLSKWKAASQQRRKEYVAGQFAPLLYSPTLGDAVWRDLLRISCGVRSVSKGLKAGTLQSDTAAAVLQCIFDDLEGVTRATEKVEHKLAKAKRKLKRRA